MTAINYQQPAVKAVRLSDSKWRKRQEWLAKVEATMADPLDGAKAWICGMHYRGTYYTAQEVNDKIADLKDLQTKRGLNIAQERTLLVFERGRAASLERRRAQVMKYRARKAARSDQ